MQLQLVHDVNLRTRQTKFSVHLKSETGVRVGAIGLSFYRESRVTSGGGHLQAGSSAYQQFLFLSFSFLWIRGTGKHLHVEKLAIYHDDTDTRSGVHHQPKDGLELVFIFRFYLILLRGSGLVVSLLGAFNLDGMASNQYIPNIVSCDLGVLSVVLGYVNPISGPDRWERGREWK